MALTFRSEINRPLTTDEIDNNFRYFTGSHGISGSMSISGSIIPASGYDLDPINGIVTSSFSLGDENHAWADVWVGDGSIKFVSGSGGNKTTSSISINSSGGIQLSSPLLPPSGNNDLSLGSETQFWKSVYVGTGSVNFTTATGGVVASIKAIGELGVTGNPLSSGMVYVETLIAGSGSIGRRGSFSVGRLNQASGTGSFSQGVSVTSSGNFSHAQGQLTVASGLYSHAEGTGNTASGIGAHAEGSKTSATGEASHAEGNNASATGNYSHAEGDSTQATGVGSHAEGRLTTATGNYSHAEGLYSIATGSYQTVVGQYNLAVASQSAFIIGGGTSVSNRRNLLFASASHFQISASNVFLQGIPLSASGYVVSFNPTTGRLGYIEASSGSGGSGTPGGSNTEIQFNDNDTFAGSPSFTYANDTVTVTGSVTVDGTFVTPQIVNYNIDVPSNNNAVLFGPTVGLPNEAIVQNNSFLTVLGEIATPQQLQSQTLQVSGETNLNGSVTLDLNTLPNAISDAAAALLGVVVGGIYRNGNTLQIRLS